MAIDNFFITIKVKKEDYALALSRNNFLDKNNYYQKRLRIDFSESENELCLIGCLATFSNSSLVIYKFCKDVLNLNDEVIEIGKIKNIAFNNLSQNEFIMLIYQVYLDKIISFNNGIGNFVIKPDNDFYKFKRKNKKYFNS